MASVVGELELGVLDGAFSGLEGASDEAGVPLVPRMVMQESMLLGEIA